MQLESTQVSQPIARGIDAYTRIASEPPRRLRLATSAGHDIEALIYEPDGPAIGNVLIHSATACPQRFYASFARHLTRAGLRVFTYDYRGIGESRGASLRGERVTMSEWAFADARAMHAHLEQCYPDVPLVLIGHSFGGQLVGLLDEARRARAAVFVGAQLGYFGHWPNPQAFALRMMWKFLVPAWCALFGYLPKRSGLGEDLPRNVALQWGRWCSSPNYLMSEFPEARERFARFDRPLLAYSFNDDSIAPYRAVAALFAVLESARTTDRRIDPGELGVRSIGHFGFFRAHAGGKLWDETLDYILTAVRTPAARSATA